MKKFLAMFLVFTLLFSFAACNKGDDTNTDDNTTTESQVGEQTPGVEEDTTKKKPNKEEKTTAKPFENPNLTQPEALFKIIDVNGYILQSRTPKTLSSGVAIVAERYEAKGNVSNDIPANIMIDGTEVVLNGTMVKDVISQGWTTIGKNNANTAVESGKETTVYLENGNKETVKLSVTNKTTSSVAVAECTITGVDVTKTVEQKIWADFTIGGKANTSNSGYGDYINAFGNPISVNVVEYYQNEKFTHCKATLGFEKTVGNDTWTVLVVFEDVNGELKIDSCTVEVK